MKSTIGQLDADVARALGLQQRGRLQEAHDLYRRVLAVAPNHAEANHFLGLLLHSAGQHDAAAALIETSVRAVPDSAIYRSNLGVVLREAGRLEAAVASYEAALRIDATLAQTRSNLGVALLGLGRINESIEMQRQSLATAPDYAEAHANLGLALLEAGDGATAVDSFRRAIALKPDYAAAHQYLGRALLALGQTTATEASSRQAIALRPNNPAAHFTLAEVLAATGRLDEAAASYRAASQIRPDKIAFGRLGAVLSQMGNYREAVVAFRAAIELGANEAAIHAGLGRALSELGGMVRAHESYSRALSLEPENDRYRHGVAAAALAAGLIEEALAHYENLLDRGPEAIDVLGPMVFISNYRADAPPEATVRRATELGRLLMARAVPRTKHANRPDPERRLRIGLLSADFLEHPVAFFLEGVLGALDATRVELFAYANLRSHDAMTEKLQSLMPNWREIAGLGDDALEAQIVSDGIDILVDLGGHTRGGLPPVFARKPAPIAVSWLGYSGTTGLEAIDYVLADRIVAPESEERLFSERVWRLPDAYLCYTPPAGVGAVAPLPARENGYVTFGSFNNLNKVNDPTLALWARVLEAVPSAKLAFKGMALRRPETADELRQRLARFGIGPERLKLLAYEIEAQDHLGAYREVDIGLDPFPYNGTTTTCEALLMGVPVLTLRGDRFIAHVGESLMRTVGLDDWVASNAEDFVERAQAFATDLPALEALRAGLRPRLLASPLCDAPRFARHLEAAFRGMWREWCVQQGQGQ